VTPRERPPRDRWLGVELRHLAALSALASERSFRGAAERLGYVQSAVSQQIAALERLVGVRLVERSRGARPLELTEAGRLLLEHVEEILARLRAAQADLARLSEGDRASVRVGVFESVAARILPAVVAELAHRRPEVTVVPTEAATDAGLFELVARGELDLAFADLPLPPGPFEHRRLLEDPYVLLVTRDSPLAAGPEPPRLEEIVRLPLIGYAGGREQPGVEAQLRALGLRPEFVFRTDVNATVHGLVAAGVGAAIVPRLCAERVDPRLAVVELGDRLRPRVLALFWHRERQLPAAVAEFREAVVRRFTADQAG
jgi:DNA-binding transcriptional LysR family regulator